MHQTISRVPLIVAGLLSLSSSASCERRSLHAEALEEMTRTIRATTRVLRTIHTVDDARTAQSELMTLSQRALDTQMKMAALVGTKIPSEGW